MPPSQQTHHAANKSLSLTDSAPRLSVVAASQYASSTRLSSVPSSLTELRLPVITRHNRDPSSATKLLPNAATRTSLRPSPYAPYTHALVKSAQPSPYATASSSSSSSRPRWCESHCHSPIRSSRRPTDFRYDFNSMIGHSGEHFFADEKQKTVKVKRYITARQQLKTPIPSATQPKVRVKRKLTYLEKMRIKIKRNERVIFGHGRHALLQYLADPTCLLFDGALSEVTANDRELDSVIMISRGSSGMVGVYGVMSEERMFELGMEWSNACVRICQGWDESGRRFNSFIELTEAIRTAMEPTAADVLVIERDHEEKADDAEDGAHHDEHDDETAASASESAYTTDTEQHLSYQTSKDHSRGASATSATYSETYSEDAGSDRVGFLEDVLDGALLSGKKNSFSRIDSMQTHISSPPSEGDLTPTLQAAAEEESIDPETFTNIIDNAGGDDLPPPPAGETATLRPMTVEDVRAFVETGIRSVVDNVAEDIGRNAAEAQTAAKELAEQNETINDNEESDVKAANDTVTEATEPVAETIDISTAVETSKSSTSTDDVHESEDKTPLPISDRTQEGWRPALRSNSILNNTLVMEHINKPQINKLRVERPNTSSIVKPPLEDVMTDRTTAAHIESSISRKDTNDNDQVEDDNEENKTIIESNVSTGDIATAQISDADNGSGITNNSPSAVEAQVGIAVNDDVEIRQSDRAQENMIESAQQVDQQNDSVNISDSITVAPIVTETMQANTTTQDDVALVTSEASTQENQRTTHVETDDNELATTSTSESVESNASQPDAVATAVSIAPAIETAAPIAAKRLSSPISQSDPERQRLVDGDFTVADAVSAAYEMAQSLAESLPTQQQLNTETL